MKNHLWIPSIEQYEAATQSLDAMFAESDKSIAAVIEATARQSVPRIMKQLLGVLAREMSADSQEEAFIRYCRALGYGASAAAMICEEVYGSLQFVDELRIAKLSDTVEVSVSEFIKDATETARQSLLTTVGPSVQEWVEQRGREVGIDETLRPLFSIGASRTVSIVHSASRMQLLYAAHPHMPESAQNILDDDAES